MERQRVMERGEKAGVSSSSNGGGEVDVVVEMMDVIEVVGLYVGYRRTQRKECLNLVRRLKLLLPLLEEIKENGNYKLVSSEGLKTSLDNLKKALLGAKKLLKKCSCGSKIYLVSVHFCLLNSCLSLGFS
jgi:hypothetical protein